MNVQTPGNHSSPVNEEGGRAVVHFLESEIFTDIDRHFARFMERLSGTPNSEVLLAAALASRSQGLGNVCLDLRALAATLFPNDPSGTVHFRLPNLDAWVAALRKSPVVGKPSESRPLVLDASNRLYLHRYWQYEFDLGTAILRRAEQSAETINEALLAEGLNRLFPAVPDANETDWQRVAASTAVRKRLCVISGGPGTGKTRTVIALLVLLLEQAGGAPLRIALSAPTGKAAARMQEALKKWKAALSCDDAVQARLPEESFTLHRLLGGSPDSAHVKYNAENPLPYDVVVVDEASMVDLAMMAKLFAATPPSARLVLLGDKDQLASVEAGAVLGEICAEAGGRTSPLAGVRPSSAATTGEAANESMDSEASQDLPFAAAGGGRAPLARCIVELRKNYRFGAENGILALSRAINEGNAWRALSLLGLQVELLAPQSQQNATTNRSAKQRSAREPIASEPSNARRSDGIFAVSLPSAAQLKAQLRSRVVEGFGEMLRAREPQAVLQALNRFRLLCAVRRGPFGAESLNRLIEEVLSEVGLISARQRWYAGRPVLVTRNDHNLRLYNGDVGVVLPDPATGEARVWFPGADNAPRSVPPVRLPEHETVFAMTVHKSQGSEFEEVLLMLPDRESPVLTRELLYTGVTRASRRVELWFDESVFRTAVSRRVERASGLREALWGTAA